VIAAVTWPLACVVVAAMALYALTRWLSRAHVVETKIDDHRKELLERDGQWASKFESVERRVALMERNVSALSDPNRAAPLGRAYNALRQG
jgi:hypothetical protein